MDRIRVLIVDDHKVVRRGIEMFLSTDPGIEVVGEGVDGHEAVILAEQLRPDVVLLDLVMPLGSGLEAIPAIKAASPDSSVVVLTTFKDEDKMMAAVEAGADGYLLKDADGETLTRAIHGVKRGDVPIDSQLTGSLVKRATARRQPGPSVLTQRELEVLHLVAEGFSNQRIANQLELTRGTVKVHVSNILDKLEVSNRTEAVLAGIRLGILRPGTSG